MDQTFQTFRTLDIKAYVLNKYELKYNPLQFWKQEKKNSEELFLSRHI